MSKGSGRRPEADKGSYVRNWDGIFLGKERRQSHRALGAPLAGMPEWVICAQPDEDQVSE